MPRRFAQGRFSLKNPDKYMGTKDPLYRSSWEFAFMKFCDESAAIAKWASEAVRIPYRNPLTGRYTIYVPDFFINYVDKGGQPHAEIVEIKPQNQSLKEKVGKNLKRLSKEGLREEGYNIIKEGIGRVGGTSVSGVANTLFPKNTPNANNATQAILKKR